MAKPPVSSPVDAWLVSPDDVSERQTGDGMMSMTYMLVFPAGSRQAPRTVQSFSG